MDLSYVTIIRKPCYILCTRIMATKLSFFKVPLQRASVTLDHPGLLPLPHGEIPHSACADLSVERITDNG